VPCILKSSLAAAGVVEVVAGAEGVGAAEEVAVVAVVVVVQVPRVPAEDFLRRPRAHVRLAPAQVPGLAQPVARRLRLGLLVLLRAQKPGRSPRVPQPGKPPEPDSDRAPPPQARQIDRPPLPGQPVVPLPEAVPRLVS
jgi:hypothetical protein